MPMRLHRANFALGFVLPQTRAYLHAPRIGKKPFPSRPSSPSSPRPPILTIPPLSPCVPSPNNLSNARGGARSKLSRAVGAGHDARSNESPSRRPHDTLFIPPPRLTIPPLPPPRPAIERVSFSPPRRREQEWRQGGRRPRAIERDVWLNESSLHRPDDANAATGPPTLSTPPSPRAPLPTTTSRTCEWGCAGWELLLLFFILQPVHLARAHSIKTPPPASRVNPSPSLPAPLLPTHQPNAR